MLTALQGGINAAVFLYEAATHLFVLVLFQYSALNPRVMEKCYCLSVRRVSYGREAGVSAGAPPTHRLAVHDLRGAWTKLNRDLAFALIDTYMKTQVSVVAKKEKKNLSGGAVNPAPPALGSRRPCGLRVVREIKLVLGVR